MIYRIFLFMICGMASLGTLKGQSSPRTSEAAALVQKRADEERYRILRSSLDGMQEALSIQQKRINELTRQINEKLSDVERDQSKFVTRAEFEKLAEAIQELDKKRMADRDLFLKEIRLLANTLKSTPSPSVPKEPPASTKTFGSFYEYEVQPGDNLFLIIKTYNEEVFKKQGQSIGIKDVESANPGLNAELIRPGDVIKIPIPGT